MGKKLDIFDKIVSFLDSQQQYLKVFYIFLKPWNWNISVKSCSWCTKHYIGKENTNLWMASFGYT